MTATKEIRLTNDMITLVDAEDYEELMKHKWYGHPKGYAQCCVYVGGKKMTLLMHRVLMQPSKGMQVDHKNQNKLDNRRCNLRICTNQENSRNKPSCGASKYKGVTYIKHCKRWRSSVSIGAKRVRTYHKTEEEAALAYNEVASFHFGEYANLNIL